MVLGSCGRFSIPTDEGSKKNLLRDSLSVVFTQHKQQNKNWLKIVFKDKGNFSAL